METAHLGAAGACRDMARATRGVLPRAARLRRALRPRRRFVAAGARVLRKNRGALPVSQHRPAGPLARRLFALSVSGLGGRGAGPRAAARGVPRPDRSGIPRWGGRAGSRAGVAGSVTSRGDRRSRDSDAEKTDAFVLARVGARNAAGGARPVAPALGTRDARGGPC